MKGASSKNRAPDWGRMNLLIVDQDNEFRFWARSVFRKMGVMEVFSTASGAEALEILRNQNVDIGLVDLVMEDMDGVKFIKELRDGTNHQQSGMPVVLLTRSADLDHLTPAFDAGVENLIQKPVSETTLLQRVGTTAVNPQRVVLKGIAKRKSRREKDAGDHEGPERRAKPTEKSDTFEEPIVDIKRAAGTKDRGSSNSVRRAGRRPTGGRTLGGYTNDPEDTLGPSGDDGWGEESDLSVEARNESASDDDWDVEFDKSSSGTKRGSTSDDGWNDELDKSSSRTKRRSNSDADWNATFDEEKKDSRTGEDVEEIDIEAIIEQHGLWLETRAAQGQRANLEKLDIAGIDLSGKDLSNANFRSADLSDAQCAGAVFQGADLRGATLSGAILREADLTVAKLRHADLRFCDLTAAILKDADLAGAKLQGVKAQEADFTGASLLHTDLQGADLSESTGLTQAQIGKAVGDTSTSLPSRIRLIIKDDEI